jgi:hypothetical protein
VVGKSRATLCDCHSLLPAEMRSQPTATDLITRFGLRAHDEASYLAELSAQMHSRRHRALYELVAREIDASFVEAQKRLGLRQSASDTARPGVPSAKDTKSAAGALGI